MIRGKRWPQRVPSLFSRAVLAKHVFLGLFPFLLLPSIGPSFPVWSGFMAELGDQEPQAASLCHPSHPSAYPPALADSSSSAAIRTAFSPPHLFTFLSLCWLRWLWLFFTHPKSAMLWHISTWTDTFNTFLLEHGSSKVEKRGLMRTGWEGLQRELKTNGSRDVRKSGTSPERTGAARPPFWHFYFIIQLFFFIIIYS